MNVLFDHSVCQDAIRAESGYVREHSEIYGSTYTYLRPHKRVRPPRNDWRQIEIDCLPFIAHLIDEEKILAFTTAELEAEAFRALKYPSLDELDIFSGASFQHLPPPLDRSKWGLLSDQYLSKSDAIAYCECFLLSPTSERTRTFIEGMRQNPRYSLTEFEERCLRRVGVFKEICKGIDRTHYPDALHLWTAEENGIDVFLTMDKKFRNVIERQKVELHCRVFFPSDLKVEFTL